MLDPVDVVIAACDEARMIGACLDALRAQDYAGPVAVSVVDNASTDATAGIAAARGARVVREPRRGRGVARNAGLRASEAPLVAFVDAHVQLAPDWLRRMAAPFADPHIGGCQSRIDNRATDARVQRYLEISQALSNQQVLAGSLRAERNLYPWVATGHCMYRRAALDEVGGFDEHLVACEDVELAWRVVARGYRLAYVPDATAVHTDVSPWSRFVSKGFAYGRGAAQIEALYRAHGARTTFGAVRLRRRHREDVLASVTYRSGFRLQQLAARVRPSQRRAAIAPGSVDERFRPWHRWTSDIGLRISPAVIYWLHDDQPRSTVVRPAHAPRRHVLDDTADLAWRALVDGLARDQVIDAIAARYEVVAEVAAADLDALIAELRAAGLVEQAHGSGGA